VTGLSVLRRVVRNGFSVEYVLVEERGQVGSDP